MIDFSSAPKAPGVYIFKAASGQILYVGKAKDIANRISNYKNPTDAKTAALMRLVKSVEFIVCRNESEALVLENTLIKQHKPDYNISLKDGEQYAYLKVTDEKFPRILVTRKRAVKRGEKLLGPFTSGEGRFVALREATRTFGIRICNELPHTACLQYRLGFCTAPCIGKISEKDYGDNVKAATNLLSGKTAEVEGRLDEEMKLASKNEDFERALELRNRMAAISRIKARQLMETYHSGNEDFFGFVTAGEKMAVCVLKSRGGVISGRDSFTVDAIGESPQAEFILRYYESHPMPEKAFAALQNEADGQALSQLLAAGGCAFAIPKKGDKLELVSVAEKNAALSSGVAGSSQAALAVQKSLGLSRPPARIDCFDASNLAGKQIVGSCVRFLDGRPEKSFYRRFQVKSTPTQDDFASMKEIVYRRYRGALEKSEPMPDLVLIDGGIGQLHAAMQGLQDLSLEFPIAALAKREEELYIPDSMTPIKLPHSSAGLRLLMACRDEAHRFAVKYNRVRRKIESGY